MRGPLVLGLVIVVGCGTFGEGSTPTPDPGTPATDGGALDGSPPDAASNPRDADVEGGNASTDVLGSACSQLFFCDDFERVNDVKGPWTNIAEKLGATLKLANAGDSTALSVALPPEASNGREAVLVKALDVEARRVAVAFRLLVTTHPIDSDVVIADIRTATGHVFVMLRAPDKLVISAQALPSSEIGGQGETIIQSNVWRTVVVDYRASLSPSAELTVVGLTKNVIDVTKGAGDADEVKIGCSYATGGAAAGYAIDDVKIARVP